MENDLRRLLVQYLDCDVSEISCDTDLVSELGFDSLAGLRWLAVVEKNFDVRFPDDRLHEFRTLRSIIDLLEAEVTS